MSTLTSSSCRSNSRLDVVDRTIGHIATYSHRTSSIDRSIELLSAYTETSHSLESLESRQSLYLVYTADIDQTRCRARVYVYVSRDDCQIDDVTTVTFNHPFHWQLTAPGRSERAFCMEHRQRTDSRGGFTVRGGPRWADAPAPRACLRDPFRTLNLPTIPDSGLRVST